MQNRVIAFGLVAAAALAAVALSPAGDSDASSTVTFDGFDWEPLGQAVLTVTATGLEVSNIGSSGADGVRQIVPASAPATSSDPYHREVFDGLQGTGVPVGATFTWTVRGELDGVADQVHRSETATTTAGGVLVEYDLSPLAPSSATATYRLNGVDVDTETGLPVVYASVSDWLTPDDYGTGWTWVRRSGGVSVPKFVSGSVTTDEVVVTAVGTTANVGDRSAVDWTASQVGSFTIKALD